MNRRSLRVRLIKILLIPVVLAYAIIGIASYYSSFHEAEEIYDAQLAHFARVLRALTIDEINGHKASEERGDGANGDELHPVQQSFLDEGAVQCGFCMPGMIMSSKALLEKNPEPSQEEIEYALDGNLCRCAGYPKVFDAVRKAGQEMKQEKHETSG